MDDVITVFSSPAASSGPPRVDLGVIEITDSEPEDLNNGDSFWTRLKTTRNAFQNRRNVKEDSPMDVDVDVPAGRAGPSTPFLAPDPFPQVPVIRIEPEAESQTLQGPNADPHSGHLALILEVIPDVQPKHAMGLIEMRHPIYKDQVVERVLQDLFDDPSYPRVDADAAEKWKAKRKASEMEDVLEKPPSRVKIDFANVDRPKPTGKYYRKLTLVSCAFADEYLPELTISRTI